MSKDTGPSSAGYHKIATFMTCPQKYAYRWLLGLRSPVEGRATGTGSVLHEALYAHYLGLDVEEHIAGIDDRYASCVPRAMELYHEYCSVYPCEPWTRVLGAEEEVEVQLGDHCFTRRLDLIVQWNGAVWVLDHKTAGRITKRARGAEIDWSLATQEIVGKAVLPAKCGIPWGGFVLNLIGTGTEKRKVRYRRQKLSFSAQFIQSIPTSLHWYLERAAALVGTDPWGYPRSGKCEGRYGMCEYLDLCRYGRRAANTYEVEK